MSNPDKLPKEAVLDRESFHRYGPKSNVVVPIRVGGTVVGGLSFASLHRERSWPAHTVRGLEAIGEIFGLGLERKRAEGEKLRSGNKLIDTSRSNRVGELASSAVHELNEPLAAILSNAEAIEVMLASEQPDLDEIRGAVADIIQDDNRASEITQRVWTLLERDEVSGSK
jgi:GAF domain-containing protein